MSQTKFAEIIKPHISCSIMSPPPKKLPFLR